MGQAMLTRWGAGRSVRDGGFFARRSLELRVLLKQNPARRLSAGRGYAFDAGQIVGVAES
jgi:hypothetical protein